MPPVALARQLIAPSSRPTTTWSRHRARAWARCIHPKMLKDDPEWDHRPARWQAKSYELFSFLTEVRKVEIDASLGYGDLPRFRSGLRQLGIKTQPRELLSG